jgi:hypothetical protein
LEKRRIPRHVDGRIKVFLIPIKIFLLKVVPFSTVIFVVIFKYFNPFIFFTGGLVVLINIVLHCELNNRETTFDILKQAVKYQMHGDRYHERSCLNVTPDSKRCIRNKITKPED